MNLRLRVRCESAGQKAGTTFEPLWRASEASSCHAKGRSGVIRAKGSGIGCAGARASRGRARSGSLRGVPAGTLRAIRSGGTRGRSRRFSVLPGGASRGPAGRGKGGDGMSLSGWCGWIRSVRCGRWPHPQNGPPGWRRRVRGVEMPWSGRPAGRWSTRVDPPVRHGASHAPIALTGGATPADNASAGLRAPLTAPGGRLSLRGPREARRARARSVRVVPVWPGRSW